MHKARILDAGEATSLPAGLGIAGWVDELGMRLATERAADPERWLWRKGVIVSWDAIALQVARRRSYAEVAEEYGVLLSRVRARGAREVWQRTDPAQLPRMALRLAMQLTMKATAERWTPPPGWIERQIRWTPIGSPLASFAPPVFSDGASQPSGVHALDDPDNPDRRWRDRARDELAVAAEEADQDGETDRAAKARALLASVATEREGMAAATNWSVLGRASQRAPERPWRIWLMMGGRGAGKTRAGAEWVRGLVERGDARRVALVGPTLGGVREVMIEGPSGLKAIAPDDARPKHQVSRRRLVWPNGAEAFVFSAEEPDSLRGPQFDAAWCDEIGAWEKDVDTWNNLLLGLRLGVDPRVAATTTPRARELVKQLVEMAGLTGTGKPRGGVVITRAPTQANARRLAPGWLEAMTEHYAGTRLARQELEGEFLRDPEGAMFTRAMIEPLRVGEGEAGAMERVVVAVDPPAGAERKSDACGIVAAGLREGVVYVLEDATVRGLRPLEWAERVVETARRWGAGAIVAEANNGGDMVRDVLERSGATPREGLRVKLRHATKSKSDRAEPISAFYDQGKVRHAGVFRELEDEMCRFGAKADTKEDRSRSPDRVDALVWAVSELLQRRAAPKVERL